MYDFEIAFYLYKLSRLLEIFEENKYKSDAYFKAAMAVDSYSTFITEVYQSGRLKDMEGIGNSSAHIIKNVIETGRCPELEKLEKEYNIEDYSLILSHGLSTRTIRKLFDRQIKTASQLEHCLHSNDGISDLGKSEKEKIHRFLRKYKESCGYYLYSYACCLRNELLELLNKGRDAEIAFVKTEEWKDKVTHISVFCKEDTYDDVKEKLSGSSRYHNFSFDKIKEIQCVTSFGIPVLIYFTEAVSGCSPVRPVLHGDLHMHTKWSDGKHSIEEMADYAAKLGRRYIGISDHSYSLKVARGISEVDAL